MKKLWIIAGLLIFFSGAAAWGTVDYVWVGSAGGYGGNDTDWEDPGNWEDGSGSAVSNYPGELVIDDTATINSATGVTYGGSSSLELDELNLSSAHVN
ncbi:MAG: hypothetical protein LBD71_06500, partial [Treponema sp.]|nr:hypothetical protein [Treponema sp.]